MPKSTLLCDDYFNWCLKSVAFRMAVAGGTRSGAELVFAFFSEVQILSFPNCLSRETREELGHKDGSDTVAFI